MSQNTSKKIRKSNHLKSYYVALSISLIDLIFKIWHKIHKTQEETQSIDQITKCDVKSCKKFKFHQKVLGKSKYITQKKREKLKANK